MASEKRCLYEVLGVQRGCTADEIRSAYKKMALQRHPDKLVQSGVSEAEATASFQELVNAYEILSDPNERAWYDSHRSQILLSDRKSAGKSTVPDLYSYFSKTVFSGYSDSGKGFYRVYSKVFNSVFSNEVNYAKTLGLGLDSVQEAPLMGNLDSPYTQVTAFYNYWLGFSTIMDFGWMDQYDVMAGPNRKSKKWMEEENKKVRKKARKEYNSTVQGLAKFVKKRDKRVIDMQIQKGLEMERKREEERERKKTLEREKLEKARAYQEPEWARVEEEEIIEDGIEEELEDEKKKQEFYCVVCGKKFKSEKQWKNHEQSKKHKERVAELGVFQHEVQGQDSKEKEEVLVRNSDFIDVDNDCNGTVEDSVRELDEQFRNNLSVQEEYEDNDGDRGVDNDDSDHRVETFGLDDETSILKAMLLGHKSRKNVVPTPQPESSQLNIDGEEPGVMEYNNRKSTRRKKGGKTENGKEIDGETTRAKVAETNGDAEKDNSHDSSSTPSLVESVANSVGDHHVEKNDKIPNHPDTIPNNPVDRKGGKKKDALQRKEVKESKNLPSKGRKSKGSSKLGNLCDTCGEEFDSRNRLHRHLGETGHASLKHR